MGAPLLRDVFDGEQRRRDNRTRPDSGRVAFTCGRRKVGEPVVWCWRHNGVARVSVGGTPVRRSAGRASVLSADMWTLSSFRSEGQPRNRSIPARLTTRSRLIPHGNRTAAPRTDRHRVPARPRRRHGGAHAAGRMATVAALMSQAGIEDVIIDPLEERVTSGGCARASPCYALSYRMLSGVSGGHRAKHGRSRPSARSLGSSSDSSRRQSRGVQVRRIQGRFFPRAERPRADPLPE